MEKRLHACDWTPVALKVSNSRVTETQCYKQVRGEGAHRNPARRASPSWPALAVQMPFDVHLGEVPQARSVFSHWGVLLVSMPCQQLNLPRSLFFHATFGAVSPCTIAMSAARMFHASRAVGVLYKAHSTPHIGAYCTWPVGRPLTGGPGGGFTWGPRRVHGPSNAPRRGT